jgi:hypothetical protein
VALGAGAILTWRVQAKERQLERQFQRDPGLVVDGARLSRQLSDGGRLETWQYVGYGLGVATLAGAVTCFAISGWWPWDRREQAVTFAPVAAPGSAGGILRVGL